MPFGMPVRHMKPGSNAVGPGPSEGRCVSRFTNERARLHGKSAATTV